MLPLLPLRTVADGLSVTARLPPILLGAFLVSHPCFSRPSWMWMYSTRELLPEALVRGEEELSVLGKQQGLEGLQPQGLFGLYYASGSFDCPTLLPERDQHICLNICQDRKSVV